MGVEIYRYTSDPGDDVLLGKGSVVNLIAQLQRSPRFASGALTVGIVGGVTNDQGAPGTPVLLENGVADLLTTYGPFLTYVGEGAAAGYEGNLCAQMDGLDAPRLVLVPVDYALKDKTITDATAVDLEVSIARGVLDFTVEADDDVFSVAGHTFVANDTIQLVTLSGGTGAAVATTYHVIAPVVAGTSFKLSATQGGASLAITLDGSGTLRPIAHAAADHDAFVLPAGTRLQATGGGFIVRTLEPVSWAENAFAAQTVRVAKVSGTEAAMNTVDEFVATPGDDSLVITTTATTVPDTFDAAELALRYDAALDDLNDTDVGQSIDIIACDRNEPGICDALAAHATASINSGVFRLAVVAPPVGTSLANARLASGDGVARATLDGDHCFYIHPGWTRTFKKGADNLIAPDYLATFTGQFPFACVLANTPPWANPAAVDNAAPVLRRWGAAGIASPGYGGQAHWAANIVTPQFVKDAGRVTPTYRDGITAAGVASSLKRAELWVSDNAIQRLLPYHKGIASTANRESAVDAVGSWLSGRKKAEQIAAFAVSGVWNAEDRHFIVEIAVQEIGTMDVITIKLTVSSSGIEGAEEAA